MIGGISGTYSYYGAYHPYMAARNAEALQGSQRAAVLTGGRAASPETPVQPVRPVTSVDEKETPAV